MAHQASLSRKRRLVDAYEGEASPISASKRAEHGTPWAAAGPPQVLPTPQPAALEPMLDLQTTNDQHMQLEPQTPQQQVQQGFQLVPTPALSPAGAPAAPQAPISSPFTNPTSCCRALVLHKACHPDFALPQLLHALSPAVKRSSDGLFSIDAHMMQRIARRLTPEQQASLAGLWQFVVNNYRHSLAIDGTPANGGGLDGGVVNGVSKEPTVTIEEEDDEQGAGSTAMEQQQQQHLGDHQQQQQQQWQQAQQPQWQAPPVFGLQQLQQVGVPHAAVQPAWQPLQPPVQVPQQMAAPAPPHVPQQPPQQLQGWPGSTDAGMAHAADTAAPMEL